MTAWQSFHAAIEAWGLREGRVRNLLIEFQTNYEFYVEGIKGFPSSERRRLKGSLCTGGI